MTGRFVSGTGRAALPSFPGRHRNFPTVDREGAGEAIICGLLDEDGVHLQVTSRMRPSG